MDKQEKELMDRLSAIIDWIESDDSNSPLMRTIASQLRCLNSHIDLLDSVREHYQRKEHQS